MSHVATAPHECAGNLIFCEYGLSPYWAIGTVLTRGFDGHGETEVDVDGETWTLSLTYQQGGIAPRLQDDVGGDRLYEFRIGAHGRGERKANFLIQPRFAGMRHYETGEPVSSPFDTIAADEGVNVRFSGSNLEPSEFRALLPMFARALARAGDVPLNTGYFAGDVHEMSNITTYERYVRINRSMSPKLVGRAGIMQRLLHLYATEEGSQFEYKADNRDVVGYNHRVVLGTQDARELVSGHRYGKQIKHYHPKHVRTKDETDPLYHPKVGVLLKKSLNGQAFQWKERRELRREIDETLINLLYWANIPTRADQTTYIPDEHFAARPAERTVGFEADPTPEMEAQQEALLVTTLRDMCDSDVDLLETLVTDGGEQHPQAIATATERSISTVYRALDRLQGIVRNDGAGVTFASKKIEQEIAGIVESTEYQIQNAADRVAKLCNLETRQAASSAWQQWCTEYAAKVAVEADGDELTLRIDTLLSRFKSTSQPYLPAVLDEAFTAWNRAGRDPLDLRNARLMWRDPDGNQQTGWMSAALD